MRNPTPFNIDNLFKGYLSLLRNDEEYFTRLTDHKPELGRLNETHLTKLLRAYLPSKVGVGTGFIVSGGAQQCESPQCDIILYDAINNAPLYKSEAWSIYPIEMVYGVIEVKTRLNKERLRDTFSKCAYIRSMAKGPEGTGNKAYIRANNKEYRANIAPRFFVFAYKGWNNKRDLEKNFTSLSQENEKAHIHGVCSLSGNDGLFIQRFADCNGESRFSPVDEKGFRHFLMTLPKALDTMVTDRSGPGFDTFDIAHYLPSAARRMG